MADEERPEEKPQSKSSGSGLSKKWHGVPVWGWALGGGAVVGVIYVLWKRHEAAKTASSTTSPTTSTSTATGAVNNCYSSTGTPVPCTTASSGYDTLGGSTGGGYYGGYPFGTSGTTSKSGTTSGTGTTTQASTSSGGTSTSNSMVNVPSVVGMTQEAANSAIAAAGLVPSGSAVIPGKTLTVDTQSPGAGASVARGSTVYLTSTVHTTGAGTSTGGSGSTGASQVTVPNVVGKDVVSASAACQAVGLKLTPEVPAVSGETHVVTSQSPASGTKVAAGSTVTIAYKTTGSPAKTSTGTPATLVKVPALVGKDVVAASSLCQGVGLIMKPEPAAVAGKTHTVTGQSPAAGSSVTRGSTVNITYKTS